LQIAFLNKLSEQWEPGLQSLKKEFPHVDFIEDSNPDIRQQLLKTADAVISGKLTKEEVEIARNLKILFIPYTGLNNFPVELLKERNILISNTHANARYVAEKAVALALALLGRIVEYHNDLKKGLWNRSFDESDTWISIQGRTCGIIGYGSIGRYIARFLKAFDCRIIGFKKRVNGISEYADELTTDLKETIDKSYIIFICIPLTDETKGMINSEVLSRMKDKFLVNVSRGSIVDEDALYNSLKTGVLAGAALDVWYNYPGKFAASKNEQVYPSSKPIYDLPNVVISPHKASNTREAIVAMIDDTLQNIREYLLTGRTKDLIEKEHLY
jgi:phosphoglycerate dehydrogenase-like enzyme